MRPTLILFYLLTATAFAQSPDAPQTVSPAEREAHWKQDLQTLSAGLKAPGIRIAGGIATRGQKDFPEVYPNFDADLASITEAIPKLTDAEIFLRLMKLIASAHIGHNTIQLPTGMGFLNRLPVDFHWFSDGLAVSAATSDHTALLGAKVLGIGGRKPEQFLDDVTPYLSFENDTERHAESTNLMTARGVLLHFGMIGPDGNVSLQLEKASGESVTVSLPLVDRRAQRIGISEGLHIPAVLYRSHPNSWYWSEYLPDSQTLFIQYNRCQNDSSHHFADVSKQALADADSHTVKRVVIDLRFNGGGDSSVINPLKSGLASRLKSLGRIYVLIGPDTFSSGVQNAEELHKDLSATLVGEATGGMPGGYGEVGLLTLPNSKLVVRFTTKHFGPKDGGINTLKPDIPVPVRLADFIAGHDPAFEAAIAAQ